MTIGFVASAILGLVIGVRFRVYSLVPVTLLMVAAGVAANMLAGIAGMAALTATLTAFIGLQLGYVCGSFAASIKEQPVSPALEAAVADGTRRHTLPTK